MTIESLKKTTLPCHIGKIAVVITADVVESNTPLLLNKKSIKRAQIILNFGNDTVRVRPLLYNAIKVFVELVLSSERIGVSCCVRGLSCTLYIYSLFFS